ncbi:DUF2382 domain-containing protein [Lacicoccus alkaliphilus]|uniref:Conserved domain-containing protein n=1 Tax=Lacicoccus alkaliphilus DSM 16010 TaxID=1123231 RepID=A0A1M7HPB2_9BACL|nr:DUF2382 domain-containing protein [Salinicoccus alkaliphilus]SHM30392.1 conserved domain-containing protein [Salinicoccus alkaliphilus DSM 16010]
MSKMEKFKSEQELVGRIEQLRADGVRDDEITVFSKDSLENTSLNYTDVNFKDAEGSAWDKFAAFFTSEEPEERVMKDMNLSESEQQEYINAMQAGDILLYVDDNTPPESQMGTGAAAGAGVGAGTRETTESPVASTSSEDRVPDPADDGVAQNQGHLNDKAGRKEDEALRPSPNTEEGNQMDKDYEGTMRAEDDVTGTGAAAGTTRDAGAAGRTDEEESLELREERLNVDKENVKTGEVQVDKHVETERQEVDVPVEREEVEIERRPVSGEKRAGGSFDDTSLDGDDSINVPLHEEKVNVSKDNVVDEEVVVKKNKVTDTEHVEEDVRREELDVKEDDSALDHDRSRDNDKDRF